MIKIFTKSILLSTKYHFYYFNNFHKVFNCTKARNELKLKEGCSIKIIYPYVQFSILSIILYNFHYNNENIIGNKWSIKISISL